MQGSSNKNYFLLLPYKTRENKKGFWLCISLPCPHYNIFPININEDYGNISRDDYVSMQINCHLTGYKFQNIGDSTSISYPACNPGYSHLFTERNRKLLAGTDPSPLRLELDYLFSLTASVTIRFCYWGRILMIVYLLLIYRHH